MDERPSRRKKSPFSNKNGYVWTKDQSGGKNVVLKQKGMRVDERPNRKDKSPFSNKNGYLWTGPKLYLSTNSFITTQFTQWFRYC